MYNVQTLDIDNQLKSFCRNQNINQPKQTSFMKTPAYRCTVTIMHLLHVINIMIGYISCSSLIGKNMVQLCKKQQDSPYVSQKLTAFECQNCQSNLIFTTHRRTVIDLVAYEGHFKVALRCYVDQASPILFLEVNLQSSDPTISAHK